MALTGRSRPRWKLAAVIFVLLFGIDLGTKAWAFRTVARVPVVLDGAHLRDHPTANPIPWHNGRAILPFNLMEATLVLNPGAVFGLASGARTFFVVFTVIALLVGAALFMRHPASSRPAAVIAMSAATAGAAGNLWDRVHYGRVRDFLHLLPDRPLPFGWNWPGSAQTELFPWVFNIADTLLLIGMTALLLILSQRKKADADDAG